MSGMGSLLVNLSHVVSAAGGPQDGRTNSRPIASSACYSLTFGAAAGTRSLRAGAQTHL